MTTFQKTPVPAHSPWGKIETARQEAPGIWSVSTPSHGGFIISDERLAAMPEVLRAAAGHAGAHCFEEDCEWALVVCSFPEEFDEHTLHQARLTIRGTSQYDYPGFRKEVWTAAAAHVAEPATCDAS